MVSAFIDGYSIKPEEFTASLVSKNNVILDAHAFIEP